MLKNYKLLFCSLFFCFIPILAEAQLGNSCGIPAWYSTTQYPGNSYVRHNNVVYKNSSWSQGAGTTPGSSTTWTAIGSCDEQLIINNPSLAYTACSTVSDWNSSTPNYNTNNIVRYNNGVYKAKYWVAGTEIPDQSSAYTFLGVCIIPIAISPTYADGQIIIKTTLSTINLTATLNLYGFSATQNKVEIKKTTESAYTSYNMSISGNTIAYNWIPAAYGDYNIRYTSINSIGVSTVINTTIKIAISAPAAITITSPPNATSYSQLNFSPIPISFTVQPSSGSSVSSILFKDTTAGTNATVSTNPQNSYTFNWTPQNYGNNALQIVVTDNNGTVATANLQLTIVNPATQNISFASLPNQLKAINGINKTYVFDKTITSLKRRNITIFDYTITGNVLKITPKKAGRSGLQITTSDGAVYHLGLRIDNANGSPLRYPDYVSVGSVSEDTTDDVNFYNNGIDDSNLLKNNRMDVRYIYINGGPISGWNTWQPDRAIKFARNSLKMGLIPFFVFYNIPDGSESYDLDLAHVKDASYMTAYFNNLNLFLNQVKAELGDEFFGVVLEPDFLGYMQQYNEPITTTTAVSATSISQNAGTLKTLVERINFELNKKRTNENLNMEFGWQLNLWAKSGVAGPKGIIRETDTGTFTTQLNKIKQTAVDIFQYTNSMGIMSNDADFISIDKYGLDAMGAGSTGNPADPFSYTWFWNNDHWMNYLNFVQKLYEASGKHVILWQIPVGHINGSETLNERTAGPFQILNNTSQHYEDSATTFFFGDTVNFSNDTYRYNYFSQNKHADPKLQVNPTTKKVTFGNHFAEVKSSGTKLILMGAGVGASTDGIGNPGTTLTDDHFWIQKLQYYYTNQTNANRSLSTNAISKDLTFDSPLIVYPNPVKDILTIDTEENIEVVYIIDMNGKNIITQKNKNSINLSELQKGWYIVAVKLENGKKISGKIIKN
ncbi:T9SS type A sorting domain-containing protein [Flavobacterium poyangense]|uniref:T9SS type A sorting domain-containing protein n=1 Tax=Flavobacterium poyangense TaxID=2204302 RepID=UPI00141E2A9E|nr:T9SS type A sorting domain-containing protein [Flavobacterium sp. JXAS1]